MSTALEIILPVFGLILTGWLLARIRLLSADGVKGLTTFVFYVAIPALLFRNLSHGQAVDAGDLAILIAYFAGSLTVFAGAALLLGRTFRLRPAERVVLGMGSAFSNNVQLGIPIVLAGFGSEGLVLLMLIISVHSIVMIGLPTVLIEIAQGQGERAGTVLRTTLLALLRNPVIVGLAVGVAWGMLGLPVPLLLDRFTGLVGQAAVPCSLFAMGASLAGYRLAGALNEAAIMAALKLLLHPLLVWLVASQLLQLPPLQIAVATVAASLPIGINVFIIAQNYNAYPNRATSATLISTAASVLTVGLLVAHFRGVLGG